MIRSANLRFCVFAFLVALTLGFLGTHYYVRHQTQFSRARYSTAEILRSRTLSHRLKVMNEEVAQLKNQTAERTVAMGQVQQEQDLDRMHSLQQFMGIIPPSGEGVLVELSDNPHPAILQNNPNVGIVHNTDLVSVINELRAAGARYIALNGLTLNNSSSVSCNGPIIYLNQSRIASPFRIQAIGNSSTLMQAMRKPRSLLTDLRKAGIGVSIQPQNKIDLQAAVLPNVTPNL